MNQEPTNQDILEAINTFSTKVDERFSNLENDVSKLKNDVSNIWGTINTQMVTKDYLDDKMADLRGDMVVLMRKEDVKVKKLVNILEKRNLISKNEAKEIMSMEPFPQLSL